MLGAAVLLGATAYAQTQKTNRTKTKTHDRTEVIKDDSTSNKAQTDKADHEADMDRNNPNNTTTPAKNTDPKTSK
jgi:hypothetical protein